MTTKSGNQTTLMGNRIRQRFLGQSESRDIPASDFRVVLYSHDTMGIGHMRRNLLIASQIKSHFPNASILTIAGAREACHFAQSANIDCLTLPSFHKRPDGTYTSRSLGISADEILVIRSRTILAAIQSYQPDLLIADKIPAGAGGELLPSLEWLSGHSSCHCVLGLRDILDDPAKVMLHWKETHAFDIIRNFFPSVWIYGDPQVYDAIKEYEFPVDIANRATFTGYLDSHLRTSGGCVMSRAEQSFGHEAPYVLCTIGGGEDGHALPVNFVEAIRATGRKAVLLTGPYMPQAMKSQIFEAAKTVPSLRVLEFVDEGDLLIKNASHVVSMGGYNTLSAILSFKKPALIVPRVTPRQEQLIRATRLEKLGFIQTIHPDDLKAEKIIHWLNESGASQRDSSPSLDMDGLHRICDLIHARFPVVKNNPAAHCSNGAGTNA